MIFIRSWYLLLYFVGAFCAPPRRGYGRGAPAKPKTTSCGMTTLQAGDKLREFTSPGYPGVFAEQTQCSWRIEAPVGSRVKLKIKDFFLLNQHICGIQYVEFQDHFSGQHYGPLCGKRQSEDLVSSGNSVTIRLESDTVGLVKKYRGFKILFMKTYDPPTLQMRDSDGKWKNFKMPMSSTTIAPSVASTDNIVDENDNESINRKNLLENEKNVKEAEKVTTERITITTTTLPQKIQPTIRTTTIPGLWTRNIKKSNLLPTRRPPIRNQYPAYDKTPEGDKDKTDAGAEAGKYLAIILAFIIVGVVGFFIFYKRRKTKEEKENKKEGLSCNVSTVTKNALETELPQPKKYRCHNYEMVTPLGNPPSNKNEEPIKQILISNKNPKSADTKPDKKVEDGDHKNRRKNKREHTTNKISRERSRTKHKTITNNNVEKRHKRERPGEKRDKPKSTQRKASRERKHTTKNRTEKKSSSDDVRKSRNVHRNRRTTKPENELHKPSENEKKRTSENRHKSKDEKSNRRHGNRQENRPKNKNKSENTKHRSKPRTSTHHKTKRRHHRRD